MLTDHVADQGCHSFWSALVNQWHANAIEGSGQSKVRAVQMPRSWNGAATRNAAADDTRHAEQIATDHAVGAATIRFDEFDAWIGRLKVNTAPALANKFDATAPKLQEILTPLQ